MSETLSGARGITPGLGGAQPPYQPGPWPGPYPPGPGPPGPPGPGPPYPGPPGPCAPPWKGPPPFSYTHL
ncbi:isocitrate dehydrogenase (NADP(+)), partial [Streptomyces sp. WAC04770]